MTDRPTAAEVQDLIWELRFLIHVSQCPVERCTIERAADMLAALAKLQEAE